MMRCALRLAVVLPLLLALAGASLANPGVADNAALRQELRRLIRTGGVAVGVNGEPRFVYSPGQYVPASIFKLATAQAAFHELGPDFRFRTEVYVGPDHTLYIRGLGDPFLVSEEWRRLVGELEQAGVLALPLERLVLDIGAFDPDLKVDGVEYTLNPYDARPGALVTNFNTVNLLVRRGGRIESAEPQTPLTPLGRELARRLRPRRGEKRINLSRDPSNAARYSGEIALAVLRERGAKLPGGFQVGSVPPELKPVLDYRSSQSLREVVAGMLEYSNNFIANQVLLQIALKHTGPPARLEEGVERLREFLIAQLGLAPDSFELVEGSGISRLDRVDLQAMLRITDSFYPWRGLMRAHQVGRRSVLAKTGTLKGVYSLAGFLPAPEGERRAFVIILNQTRQTRDDVLNSLLAHFAAAPWPEEWGP
jgi:D-alanyl-D-alanine carboxypeptidase/D-alanyl-D-alanine-endopeptidase (penicillin-binding protein 4)